MQSLALLNNISLSDFLNLTPVEFEYFLYVKRVEKESERYWFENQMRLVNAFTFNTTFGLKKTVKDPAKLYSIDFEDKIKERVKKETEYKPFIDIQEYNQLIDLVKKN